MSIKPEHLFVFNSGLPSESDTPQALANAMGPWANGFRGRNIGNGYITHAFLKSLFGCAAKIDHIQNGWSFQPSSEWFDLVNSNYKYFIFIAQDFIRESFSSQNFDSINKIISNINIPIVPISLGANNISGYDLSFIDKLSQSQIKFLNILSDKSVNIGVRGDFTEEVLKKIGINNVIVTGCPSFFENGNAKKFFKKKFNENNIVTTGAFFSNKILSNFHLLQDEMFFIDEIYLSSSSYTSQNEIPYESEALHITLALYEKAFQDRLIFFTSFEKWREFYLKHKICMTVGTRLHGAIQAWNAGAVGIVTNSDARAREVCEYHGIPHKPFLTCDTDLRELYEEVDLDLVSRKYRDGWNAYEGYLKSFGIVPWGTSTEFPPLKYPDFQPNHYSYGARRLSEGYQRTWVYIRGLIEAGMSSASKLDERNQEMENLTRYTAELKVQYEETCLAKDRLEEMLGACGRAEQNALLLLDEVTGAREREAEIYRKQLGVLEAIAHSALTATEALAESSLSQFKEQISEVFRYEIKNEVGFKTGYTESVYKISEIDELLDRLIEILQRKKSLKSVSLYNSGDGKHDLVTQKISYIINNIK